VDLRAERQLIDDMMKTQWLLIIKLEG